MLALVACKSIHTPAPASGSASTTGSAVATAGSAVATAGSAGSADPWNKPAAPATPDTPETRKARAQAALARVEGIMPKLAKVRDLTVEHPVPTEYQTTEDFRKYLEQEIQKELPADKAKAEAEAYLHIGLFS